MSVKDVLVSLLQDQKDPAFLIAIEDGVSLSSGNVVWSNAAFAGLLDGLSDAWPNQAPPFFLNENSAGFLQNGLVEKKSGAFQLRNAHSSRGPTLETMWFDLDVTFLPSDCGDETHIFCRFVDVTERETLRSRLTAAQAEIETVRSRFAYTVNSIPEGFAMFDRDDILVAFNSKYAELYKHSAPAIKVGATFESIMRYGLEHGQYPEAEGQEEAWLAERLDRKNRKRAPVERKLPDGKFIRVQEAENENGDIVGLRTDVTQYYEHQQELESKAEDLAKANEEAKAASRAKDGFFARMSHELRTPMNGILGMTEVLQHTDLNPQQRSYLKTISGSATSLLSIINDILDYSKATEGKFTFANERFSLKDTIYEAAGLMQPLAHDKNLDFWVDYPRTVPTHFFGDTARIRQVLLNHLGNALKFTDTGHFGIRVRYQNVEGRDRIVLSIEDTGRGVPQGQMSSLFSAYEQTHQDPESAVEGTGLGLAISKALVEQMGGAIDVASKIGVGSCFSVSLNLPVCPVSHQKLSNNPISNRKRDVALIGPPTGSNAVLERTLEAMNCRVFAFENADEVPNELDEFHSVIWDGDLGGHLGRRKRSNPGNQSDPGAHILMVSTPQRHAVTGSDSVDFSTIWLKPVRSEEIERVLFPDLKPKFGHCVDDKISGHSETVRNNLSRGRVLVVDDNKTNRLVAGKLLETVGIKVDFASNGLEALDLYQALRPMTVFMDVTMPVMDGIDATLHIRKLEVELGIAPCKIFALTANTHKTQVELCMRSGVDGIIGKPVKRSDLIDAINSPNTARGTDVDRKTVHKLRAPEHQEMSGSPFQRGC